MKKPAPELVESLLAAKFNLAGAISALEPHWANGCRPKFWQNDAAKIVAMRLYGRATQKQTAEIMNERFGPETTSQAGIGRFWKHVLSKAVAAGLAV